VTSAAKIHANRANARASTGPKTADGRARSARNALRHALSIPVCSNPEFSEQVETLAREIAGPDAKPEILALARRVAEAQIDLRRVRYARCHLLSRALADRDYAQADKPKLAALRFLSENKLPEVLAERLLKSESTVPGGPPKFVALVSQEAKQLLAMDRYERRALSRRKSAIRAFDETRR
jgi:hypothetical protein